MLLNFPPCCFHALHFEKTNTFISPQKFLNTTQLKISLSEFPFSLSCMHIMSVCVCVCFMHTGRQAAYLGWKSNYFTRIRQLVSGLLARLFQCYIVVCAASKPLLLKISSSQLATMVWQKMLKSMDHKDVKLGLDLNSIATKSSYDLTVSIFLVFPLFTICGL